MLQMFGSDEEAIAKIPTQVQTLPGEGPGEVLVSEYKPIPEPVPDVDYLQVCCLLDPPSIRVCNEPFCPLFKFFSPLVSQARDLLCDGNGSKLQCTKNGKIDEEHRKHKIFLL